MAGNSQDQNFFKCHFVPFIGGVGLVYSGIELFVHRGSSEALLWGGIVGSILLLCGVGAFVMVGFQAYKEKKEGSEEELRATVATESESPLAGEATGEKLPLKEYVSGELAKELALFLEENRSVVNQLKKDSYKKAFQEYREKCTPLCDSFHVLSQGEEMRFLQRECEWLLERLKSKWKASAYRGSPDFMYQQQIALFLIPTFRSLYPEEEKDFPHCLRDAWNKRYPNAQIECGDFENIVTGFQHGSKSILMLLTKG